MRTTATSRNVANRWPARKVIGNYFCSSKTENASKWRDSARAMPNGNKWRSAISGNHDSPNKGRPGKCASMSGRAHPGRRLARTADLTERRCRLKLGRPDQVFRLVLVRAALASGPGTTGGIRNAPGTGADPWLQARAPLYLHPSRSL